MRARRHRRPAHAPAQPAARARPRRTTPAAASTAIWFNQEHLARILQPGDELLLRGRVAEAGRREMAVRSHEVLGGRGSEGVHTQGLVPVYPATEQLPPRRIRELVDLARPLARAARGAPAGLDAACGCGIGGAADSLVAVHFPRSRAEARLGRRRLVLEELIVLQLGLLAVRRARGARPARRRPLRPTGERTGPLLAALPFALTRRAAARRTARSPRPGPRPRPMRRLLQGEVGSGKTVVAALAICQAVEAGAQAALLVPTETLAEQHLRTLDALLAPAGLTPGAAHRPGAAGRARAAAAGALHRHGPGRRRHPGAAVGGGRASTASGLVVVDEQHRFGVEQRQALSERAAAAGGPGGAAHLLYMTATPIPRTLALTAYGDLRGLDDPRPAARARAGRDPLGPRRRPRGGLRAGARRSCGPATRPTSSARWSRRARTPRPARPSARPSASRRGPFADFSRRARPRRPARRREARRHGRLRRGAHRPAGGDDGGRGGHRRAQRHHDRRSRAPTASAWPSSTSCAGGSGAAPHPGLCLLFGEPATDEGARRLEALTQTTDGFRLAELDLEIRGEGSILGRAPGRRDRPARRPPAPRPARAGRGAPPGQAERCRATRACERPEHALLRAAVLDALRTTCRGCWTREDRRREPPRPAHRGPAGTRDPADLRPRARGAVRHPRAGRGARRARPVRRVGRARPRGALAGRGVGDVRRPLAPRGRRAIRANAGSPRRGATACRVVAPRLARRAAPPSAPRGGASGCASATPPIASCPASRRASARRSRPSWTPGGPW